jgi:hypothetical protein
MPRKAGEKNSELGVPQLETLADKMVEHARVAGRVVSGKRRGRKAKSV